MSMNEQNEELQSQIIQLPYRGPSSRVIHNGELERDIITQSDDTCWNFLRQINAVYTRTINCPGCGLPMGGPHYRSQRDQYYFRCTSHAVHPNDKTLVATYNSMFYRKRCSIRITLKAMFRMVFNQDKFTRIYNDLSINYSTISQLYRDLCVLFENDILRNNPIMLGGPGVDHVQIDESKFGKKKYHRGHRVEGVWVLGLVEAIYLGPTSVRERQQDGTYSIRVVEKYKAERRFLCTLPNRNARTLIPIIRKEYMDRRTGALVVALANDDQYMYQHQVVNHSINFATEDHVRQNRTVGLINTNIIEGMWNHVKKDLSARHRTKKECPYRLVEYLWHYENRNNIWNALVRGLSEVSYSPSNLNGNNDHYQLITEETEGGDFLDGDPTEEMDEMHAIDIELDDSSDSESEAGSQNDSDYNPEIRSEPPRAIRRVTRSRRAVVVIENQEVEPTIDDLHHMSSTALSERNISEYRRITSLIIQKLEDEATDE